MKSTNLFNIANRTQTTDASNHVNFKDGVEKITFSGMWEFAESKDFINFFEKDLPKTCTTLDAGIVT